MLLIRFSDKNSINSIHEHKQYLEGHGFVWFGKIGVKINEKKLIQYFNNGKCWIILKNLKKYYLCKCVEYSYEIPQNNNFPEYYNYTFDLKNANPFSTWFKFISIYDIKNSDFLQSIVVKSSRMPIITSAGQSMSSFFFVLNEEEISL